MANHKSAKKRIRQTITRTARNKSTRTMTKSSVQNARKAIEAKSKDKDTEVKKAISALAKCSRKGVIHWKAAARKTSRLQRAANSA